MKVWLFELLDAWMNGWTGTDSTLCSSYSIDGWMEGRTADERVGRYSRWVWVWLGG